MEIIDYIEERNFTGLSIFTFDELKDFFNLGELYVASNELSGFFKEGNRVADKHKKAIDKMDESSSFYVKNQIDAETRDELIKIIQKYFDPFNFDLNKKEICDNLGIELEKTIDDDEDLESALIPIRKWLYQFLTLIGMNRKYFIHQHEIDQINAFYSKEVCRINANLGIGHIDFDIFQTGRRLFDAGRQYIDVDKISLSNLLNDKLIHNRKHLIEITKIIYRAFHIFRGKDEDGKSISWSLAKEETTEYLKECSAKGLIRSIYKYDR